MPYIKQHVREFLDQGVVDARLPGELNYLITQLIQDYLDNAEPSYTALNDIIGVLEAVKLEFYRRVVVPYEEQKRFENGDVYDDPIQTTI